MSRVVFMCGPAGSGKSTYARQLEADGFARLSIDETAWAAGHRSQPLPEPVRKQFEQRLQAELVEHVRSGVDVVLDLSFWSPSVPFTIERRPANGTTSATTAADPVTIATHVKDWTDAELRPFPEHAL